MNTDIIFIAGIVLIFVLFRYFANRFAKKQRRRWNRLEAELIELKPKINNAKTLEEVEEVWHKLHTLDYYSMHLNDKERFLKYRSYLSGKWDILQNNN